VKVNSEGKRWRERFARLPAAVVRAVLIVAAVSKMADPLRFAGQLRGYGLVDLPQILALLAWALIAVECTLGAALIVSYRQRTASMLTALLLLAFPETQRPGPLPRGAYRDSHG
jgi:hypothetical protein